MGAKPQEGNNARVYQAQQEGEAMITNERLAEMRRIEQAATEGPWLWRYPVGGMPTLVSPPNGQCLIIDAVRSGMQRATMRFAIREKKRGGIMCHAEEFFLNPGRHIPDFQEPNNPDMEFMSAARTALPELLTVVEMYRAAIARSGLDATICSQCGEMMLTFPDGGNICADCAEVMG
jgi:hypothetical protein